MTNTEHFAENVPTELRDKLAELAEAIEENFISDYNHDAYGCTHINEIYGYHISGFIPFQNGGYEITELYNNGWSTGSYFTEAQQESESESYDYMVECFLHDVLDDHATVARDFSYEDLSEDNKRKFEDYEAEWFEGVLLRVEMWIDRGKGATWGSDYPSESVMIRLSVNYNDAPYYRSKSDETLKELNFSLDEIMQLSGENLIKQLNDSEA
jgi:hypothetical protein